MRFRFPQFAADVNNLLANENGNPVRIAQESGDEYRVMH